MEQERFKIGVWLIGAAGRVGSAVALGIAALGEELIKPVGMVTALPDFEPLRLSRAGDLVVGGHEIRGETLAEAVLNAHQAAGIFEKGLIEQCAASLGGMQANIRPGVLTNVPDVLRNGADRLKGVDAPRAGDAVDELAQDMAAFRAAQKLDHVVVVNLASCESTPGGLADLSDAKQLEQALVARSTDSFPGSCLYALAAIKAGCSYINFTPSVGIELPAIRQRADTAGICYAGRDGKTGETLIKSVLGPMFAMRNLKVLSWVGHNILGNRDGAVLDDPAIKAGKIESKRSGLAEILGQDVDSPVSIEYVQSLDDWKVAWDFVHFEGFLGTKMNMQFTWQGADSILAAPLVIDLIRLTAHEWRRGGRGCMHHLASFFKSPMDVPERSHFEQWCRLMNYVRDSQADGATG